MKIPQQDEVIEIEYKGERISAIVHSVTPHISMVKNETVA